MVTLITESHVLFSCSVELASSEVVSLLSLLVHFFAPLLLVLVELQIEQGVVLEFSGQ